jgi:cob(I)alamin adenosyltransferase
LEQIHLIINALTAARVRVQVIQRRRERRLTTDGEETLDLDSVIASLDRMRDLLFALEDELSGEPPRERSSAPDDP